MLLDEALPAAHALPVHAWQATRSRPQEWDDCDLTTLVVFFYLQQAAYDVAMQTFLLPADELEYVVLTKLWELGTASVRDVHGQLGKPEGLVYTTIAKVIDRLRGKGLIQR